MEWFSKYNVKQKEQNVRRSIYSMPPLKREVRICSLRNCTKRNRKCDPETNDISYMQGGQKWGKKYNKVEIR